MKNFKLKLAIFVSKLIEDICYYVLSIQFFLERILAADKMRHFFFGTLIAFICIPFLENWEIVAVVACVALLKELSDKYIRKGTFDILDILWTIISSILLYIIL